MKRYFLKYSILIAFLVSLNNLQAQVLTFDHGKVQFYTSSILSDIDAISEDINVKLDINSKEFEVLINVESFEFESDLMHKHFVEKYLETDKFPFASFKGKITQDISSIAEETEIEVIGEMTIHGVKKEIIIKTRISKKNDFTVVKTKFVIVFKDYNVDEPSILTKTFAKDVEVKSTLYLK